jgi:hypothetical protein
MGLSQTPPATKTQAQSVPVDHRPKGAEGIAQPVSCLGIGDGADGKGGHRIRAPTISVTKNPSPAAPRNTASQRGQRPIRTG